MPDASMKQCQYCAEEVRAEAVKCRHCGSMLSNMITRPWYRSQHGKRIAGVCAGLAEEFGIPVMVLRLAFVLSALMGIGAGIIIYLVLWVVMPYRPDEPQYLPAPPHSP